MNLRKNLDTTPFASGAAFAAIKKAEYAQGGKDGIAVHFILVALGVSC